MAVCSYVNFFIIASSPSLQKIICSVTTWLFYELNVTILINKMAGVEDKYREFKESNTTQKETNKHSTNRKNKDYISGCDCRRRLGYVEMNFTVSRS